MNAWQQDVYFWQLVHHYVFHKGFRLLHQKNKEVWLEDVDQKPKRILRLVRADIDWRNHLKKDVEETVKRADLLRRQLRQKKVEGDTIYVMSHLPVDEWEELEKPFYIGKKQQTKMTMTVITSELSEKQRIANSRLKGDEIPPFPIYEDVDMAEVVIGRLKREVRQHAKKQEEEIRSIFLYGKPFATYTLLLFIAIMYYIVEQNGSSTSVLTLIEFGAKYNPAIIDGEWWRLFSAMFLHIGIFHLLMNSLALFYLGSAVERMFGTSRFVLIYFVAGLIGSIASFAFNDQVSAGASGAIFGCFGALLYFGVTHPKLFFRTMGMNVLVILSINLVFGFVVPMVDNGAHIGGLVGGFMAALIVQLPKQKPSKKQWLFLLATVIGAVSLFGYAMKGNSSEMTAVVSLQVAQEYLEQDQFDKAYPYVETALEADEELADGHFFLGYIKYEEESYDQARVSFERAAELRPDFHQAHYNLGLSYMQLDEEEKAIRSFEEAIALAPNEEMYNEVYQQFTE
ncbi:rhomboid family protein [Bacillus sp. FJAT-45037]|uniref:rhomboid family protein n=1 Tax=Bacillus sp. FJAT-45037 TaxID=2011007 RepID=UPI000C2324B7|nr:rhomboid family intramembrane serine protease [Bacillus sp. FJAT-45037]